MSADETTPAVPTDEDTTAAIAATTPDSGGSGWLPMTLVVVATFILILSAATTWVRVQALDTDEWVETSSELLAEPQVQEQLATYLVDQLYSNVDVTAALQERLPDALEGLAGPIAGALRGPAIDGVERVISRPRLQQAWVEANRVAHEAMVRIVRDETRDNVSTADGEVVLDLGGAIRDVGEDLGLSDQVLDRIPEDAGQVTIIESQKLADVQDAVRLLDALSWFLFALVVVLYAVAVYIAHGRRRETLRNVGVSVALGGAVVFVLRSVGVRVGVESVVEDATNRPVGMLVGDVFTQLLADMAVTAIVVGVVIALFATLLGPHRWAVAFRRSIGASEHAGLFIALGAVLVFLLFLWWSPGLVFERWITGLTLTGLIIGAAVALSVAVKSEAVAEPD